MIKYCSFSYNIYLHSHTRKPEQTSPRATSRGPSCTSSSGNTTDALGQPMRSDQTVPCTEEKTTSQWPPTSPQAVRAWFQCILPSWGITPVVLKNYRCARSARTNCTLQWKRPYRAHFLYFHKNQVLKTEAGHSKFGDQSSICPNTYPQ